MACFGPPFCKLPTLTDHARRTMPDAVGSFNAAGTLRNPCAHELSKLTYWRLDPLEFRRQVGAEESAVWIPDDGTRSRFWSTIRECPSPLT